MRFQDFLVISIEKKSWNMMFQDFIA